MTAAPASLSKSPPKKRRWLLYTVIIVLFFGAGAAAGFWYLRGDFLGARAPSPDTTAPDSLDTADMPEEEIVEEMPMEAEQPSDTMPFSVLPADLDADGDGVSNAEEQLLGTDSQLADSDVDGFSDGMERARGYNPLVAAPNDKIVFSSDIETAAVESSTYRISTVEALPNGIVHILGRGEAYRFITVLVYPASGGEPSGGPAVVSITRVDADGLFSVVLPPTLPNGGYKAYAVATDAAGTILEKSAPADFIAVAGTVVLR